MVDKKEVDYNPVTAQVALANTYAAPVTDEKELAEEAGVVNPAHVDYAEALSNYESRSDVETLAARRAREAGVAFSDTDFVRTNITEGVVTATSVSQDEVEDAESAKREQAKATADAAEEVNPSSKVESDDDNE